MSWQIQVRLSLGSLALDVALEGENGPIALVGPNGSGKTTLLRTIAGAYRPASGYIRFGDRVLFDSEQDIDLPPESRQVGYVPQGYGLFPHLTVLDNVAFGRTTRTGPNHRDGRRTAAMELLQRMGCAHLADRRPKSLSGGEQQRVALARALLIDPRILLLDEPLAALDAPARRTLRGYLARHLSEWGGPAIVVTHDLRDIVALDANVYVVESGAIVQHGSMEDLTAHPATEFVAECFNSEAPVRQ